MKLFASDLDGTLFFNRNPRQGDIDAIKKFQSEGNLFGCCTGRALSGTTTSFDNLLNCDFYIASSGAIVCDKELNVIYGCPIKFDTVKEIVEKYQDEITIFVQTKNYYIIKKSFPSKLMTTIQSIDKLKDETIYSFCLITENKNDLDKIDEDLKQYSDIIGYRNLDAIDVVAAECSKGKAVKIAKEYFKADTSYGIGDSYNDIPLLQDADFSFTFHTSPDEVKQEADQLVDSVEEAITKYL